MPHREPKPSSATFNVLSGLLVLLSSGALGLVLGGLYVRLFVPKTGMGWDQLADFLGGAMVGGLLGLVLGAVLAWRLSPRRRLVIAVVEATLVALVLGGLWLLRDDKTPEEPVVREQAFSPWYRVTMRVAHSDEILRGVTPGDEPIPFTEAEIWTAGPDFEYTGWGPEFAHCEAEPPRAALERLLSSVQAAAAEAVEGSCRTPEAGDLGIALTIRGETGSRSATVEAGCLDERPAMVELAARLAALAAELCPPR